jgi:hypothetical protein
MVFDRVDNLRMVTVSIEAGKTAGTMDLTPTPEKCEFVFGVGSQGLTPLEFELAGKNVGEEVLIQIEGDGLWDIFQHVPTPSFLLAQPPNGCWLKLRIVGVREADQREIIKALADLAACGSQCCGH